MSPYRSGCCHARRCLPCAEDVLGHVLVHFAVRGQHVEDLRFQLQEKLREQEVAERAMA